MWWPRREQVVALRLIRVAGRQSEAMLGFLLLSAAWWVYDTGGPIELCLCGAAISPGKKIVP